MRTKNIFATLLLILTGLQTVCGQKIRLYTTDNKTFEYSIAQLDSIVFVDEQQVIEDIVVTIDANGNADGGHLFTKIDESNFYIDDIKYTANQGLLSVTGYNASFFRGEAKIINTLVYQGRKLKVTSIGTEAFNGCKVLTSVVIPNSVTNIGRYAFYGCSSLTSITLGRGVTTIGERAFYGCSGLTSITIGSGVTSIGSSAFENCSGLTKVIVPSIAAWCAISFGSVSANPLYYAHHLFSDESTEITNLVIPDGVTSIGRYAFYGCSGLTSVTIGNSVTSIGSSAFEDCTGLTSITIPNSVTRIGDYAFAGCKSLTSITIPNSVTSIGDYIFFLCTSLETVTIPNSVTSIGNRAFDSCTSLTSITIPESVTRIGDYAFAGCKSLTKVIVPSIAAWCAISFGSDSANPLYYAHHLCSDESTEITNLVIPNSVTSIVNSAFRGCSSLTSITIPNSVTSIGNQAFYGCTGLTSITIGNGVTSIGGSAFYNCSGLKDVYCHATNPPSASYSSFTYSPISSATLHVPAGSVNAYKNEYPWSDFGTIVAIE